MKKTISIFVLLTMVLTFVNSQTTGTLDGHIWVDLGLPSGTLWATTNLGASTASDYGDYFDWESADGRYGSKESSKYYKVTTEKNTDEDGFETTTKIEGYTKYVMKNSSSVGYNGFYDNISTLESQDDAATVNWGTSWRMPTDDEFTELRTLCTWIWGDLNSTKGYKVVGPNNNYIFLPAAGVWGNSANYPMGGGGGYWSSTLGNNSKGACSIQFTNTEVTRDSWWTPVSRYFGMSIRPVVKTKPDVTKKTCSSPVISYENGLLKFSCDTEGAQFHYTLSCPDVKSATTPSEICLSALYDISVYATAEGYENSEVVNVTLVWATATLSTEISSPQTIDSTPLLVSQKGGSLLVSGLNVGDDIIVYSIDGVVKASSKANGNNVMLDLTLEPNQILILKVGNKTAKLVLK